MSKKAIVALGSSVVLVLIVAILASISFLTGDELGTVKIVVDYSDGQIDSYEKSFKEEISVFDLMKQLDQENNDFTFEYTDDPQFGAYINSINEVSPDPTSEFWKFQINGDDAQTGISNYLVMDGDELRFVIDEFEL